MSERIRLNDGFDHLRDRVQDVEAAAEHFVMVRSNDDLPKMLMQSLR